MINKIIISSIVAGLLILTGCGSDTSKKVDDNGSNPDTNGTIDPHPGETAEQVKSRYLRDIKLTNGDLNWHPSTKHYKYSKKYKKDKEKIG